MGGDMQNSFFYWILNCHFCLLLIQVQPTDRGSFELIFIFSAWQVNPWSDLPIGVVHPQMAIGPVFQPVPHHFSEQARCLRSKPVRIFFPPRGAEEYCQQNASGIDLPLIHASDLPYHILRKQP
jgi:hypothetical protein